MKYELVVDNFAGGGGASTGIEIAIGRSVDIAINHDPAAIAMHRANHPNTKHYIEDVWQVDPLEACGGKPVALAWFSPDCTHFSRAKGGKPVDKNIRGLAWVAVRWAYLVRPRVIMMENVPEIVTWGPLMPQTDPITGRIMKIIGYGHKRGSKHGAPKIAVSDEGETVPTELQVMIPDPYHKGETFDGFVRALSTGIPANHPAFSEMCATLNIAEDSEMAEKLINGLGYKLEFNNLRSCDYGAPTTRTRFYMIARSDGKPIVWPKPTHGAKKDPKVKAGVLKPYRTAAECIDWSIPAQSIFERDKPLAENTLRRIARGIQKFVIENPEPFIVNYKFDNPPESVDEPLSTITSVNSHYITVPTIVPVGYGEREGQKPRVNSIEKPLGTIVANSKHYVVAPTLIQYHSETAKDEVRGQELDEPMMSLDTSNRYALSVAHIMKNYAGGYTGAWSDANEPLDTVTVKDHNSLVTAHIMTMRRHMDGQPVDEPLSTVSCSGAHHAEVQAFLIKYFSNGRAKPVNEPLDTITTKDRFAVVTIHGEEYIITDIKMRMLQPRELFNANGFPKDYIIDVDAEGNPYPKTQQVAKCGNAVTPPVPTAMVRANMPELCEEKTEAIS